MKKYISIASILLIIPILVFLFGFIRIYIAIPISILLIFSYYRLIINESNNDDKIMKKDKKNIRYYILVSIIILIWIMFSGIGNFSYQNKDWHIRNAVLRDLVEFNWPIVFDFSNTSTEILEVTGNNPVAFVYYFSYWLPSALFGKIFGLEFANIFLYFWTYLLLMLIIIGINKIMKKNSIVTLMVLIFFSGMDILFSNQIFSLSHLEWNFYLFQYSSNTTQLFWVFNQSVMVWLIVVLIFLTNNSKSIMFLASLTFCYSPFATFGMIPIAIFLILKNGNTKDNVIERLLKTIFSFEGIACLGILIIFGSYYISADSSISDRGFSWNNIDFISYIISYLLFLIEEFLLYFWILFKRYKKDYLLILIFIELLLIPLYKMTPGNDFCIRASIAPLFALTIYVIKYIIESKNVKEIVIIFCILIISAITPMHEIARSVYNTFSYTKEEYIMDNWLYSIGNPITKEAAELCNQQFYAHDYEGKFFYKYISK